MDSKGLAARWPKIYSIAAWTLIVIFAFLTVAHVVLTVLYFTGVRDTGVGYVLNFEWPAWIITLLDAAAVWALWSGYRASEPRRGLALTAIASVIMIARALWMVLVPICVVLTMAGAISRATKSSR